MSTGSEYQKSESCDPPEDPRSPSFEVIFEENDPENPKNWPTWYKNFIIGTVSFTTTIVNLPDSRIAWADHISAGDVAGVLDPHPVFGNLRPSLHAPHLDGVVYNPHNTGWAGTESAGYYDQSIFWWFDWKRNLFRGPWDRPIMGGFIFQYLGWRWINWVVLICGGVSFVALYLSKETFAPAILNAKRQRLRTETGDTRWWTKYDDNKGQDMSALMLTSLVRPLAMGIFEPICLFFDIYIGVFYAILFLCFVGYPIVFQELRGWSPGLAGLGFCGIGTGVALAVCAEPLIRKVIAKHPKDPATGQVAPEASVFPMCVGAVLSPIGQLWFSWTARESIHWISPILAGVPFGLGNGLIFIYAVNYLAGSYGIYTASANAGVSVVRYGGKIRQRSALISQLG
ncbi:hypothetical protein FE257_001590 [Aspergillus nanangensis]|uniref:Uncharacterized protein n=1 Tax=Aspergillus nanangensis TaxID=2582783 RepID=A0AAD4GX42_ASPNN|nr:hypothetical protein FE257_001590 [Aspergillus nanangensis]